MGLGEVIINKISSNEEIGHYKISSKTFDIKSFYIQINISTQEIKFFATQNFTEEPIRIVDYNNKNEKMGSVPGMPTTVLGIVLMRAFKVLNTKNFPDCLSYAA